jgi:hypothetical protein
MGERVNDTTLHLEHCREADAAEAAAYSDMYAAAPADFAATVGLRVESVAGATLLFAPGLPTPMFNRVIGLGTFEPAREDVLDQIIAGYEAAGVRNYWVSVSPAAGPASIPEWLHARGFALARRPAWAQMRWPEAAAPTIATTLSIGDAPPQHAPDLASAVAAAFEMPPPIIGWLAALVGRPGWRASAARRDDRIVGGGFLFTRRPLAWLGLGSILPAFRGHNGQLALFAARIARAQAEGCSAIHTETGEPVGDEPNPSLTNMVRCGFVKVASRANFGNPGK